MLFQELEKSRWSPREFSNDPLSQDEIDAIFSCAAWAQSSFNEQPWRYVYAQKDENPELRAQLEDLLVKGNEFAKDGALLGISFYKKTFSHNSELNICAAHDLGAANQMLALKAFDLNLRTRFIAGFDMEKAQTYVNDDFVPISMFVIGKSPSTPPSLEDRKRKALSEYVYTQWMS